jgi:hypothetical protein
LLTVNSGLGESASWKKKKFRNIALELFVNHIGA